MTDLADRLEQEHRDLADLASGYDQLYLAWYQVAVRANASDAPSRGSPTSRWPSGRDPEAASRMARATVNLTVAHGWARHWTWPAKPWTGWHTAGLTRCSLCWGSGCYVPIHHHTINGVESVSFGEPLRCLPCDETGEARHDLGALTLLPAHPVQIRTASDQLRGYVGALARLTLAGPEARIAGLLAGRCKAARLAVAPEEQDEDVEPSGEPARCVNEPCPRLRRPRGVECERCARFRQRTGHPRPIEAAQEAA